MQRNLEKLHAAVLLEMKDFMVTKTDVNIQLLP